MDFYLQVQFSISVNCEMLSPAEIICAFKIAVISSYNIDKEGATDMTHNCFNDTVMCKNKLQRHLKADVAREFKL